MCLDKPNCGKTFGRFFGIILTSREAQDAARGDSSGNGLVAAMRMRKLRRMFIMLHYCNAVVQRNLRNFKAIDVLAGVCRLARLYALSLGLLRASLNA